MTVLFADLQQQVRQRIGQEEDLAWRTATQHDALVRRVLVGFRDACYSAQHVFGPLVYAHLVQWGISAGSDDGRAGKALLTIEATLSAYARDLTDVPVGFQVRGANGAVESCAADEAALVKLLPRMVDWHGR